jgi:arylsulfatase A-like enzyme
MTMGRWMREHGYQTAAIGKLDHDDPNDAYTDPRAWDVRVKREEMNPTERLQRSSFNEDLGKQRKNVSFIGLADSPGAVGDYVRTTRAIQFFENERDPNKPFFAAIGFHAPHAPWDTLKQDFENYDPARFLLEPHSGRRLCEPHATILHHPGIKHERLTHKFRGLNVRLTGGQDAHVVKPILGT